MSLYVCVRSAGVSSSASLHYSGRDLHALVYGRSKKTVHELGEDYGADSYDESHNHPWLWLISFASTGVMAYMLWNNHLPDDKERIHRDFYAWLRSLGIPVAHAEAAQLAVQKATAAVNAGAMPVQTQTPPAADPAKPHGLPTSPAAAAAAAAAIAAVNATPIADDDPPVAGFLRRFLAFMADSVVVNSFLFLLRESMARLRPNDDSLQTVGGAVCANALATLCFDLFFMLYCDGKTPGKWLTSLRTVKQDFTEVANSGNQRRGRGATTAQLSSFALLGEFRALITASLFICSGPAAFCVCVQMDAVTAIKGATARTALSLAPPLEFVPFLCQSTHAHRYSDGVPCFVRWHDQRIQRTVSARLLHFHSLTLDFIFLSLVNVSQSLVAARMASWFTIGWLTPSSSTRARSSNTKTSK